MVSGWEAAAWLVVAAWVYLLVGRGWFWTTSIRLPDAPGQAPGPAPAGTGWPTVTVVVPARDEEAVLPATLPSLLAQEYPGKASVVLVDDNSQDATATVARAAAEFGAGAGARHGAGAGTDGGSLPLAVVTAGPRPAGWMGKPWALAQGVEAAAAPGPGSPAPPEWLLLTDADIWHPPDSLHRLVAAAQAGGRDEVSLMARLRVETGWERLIIPAFVYFFAQLYPFGRVGRPGRTAAAAGGCVLVRSRALEAAGGLAAISQAVIDDVALAARLKASGAALWLGLADEVRSVRPYPRLADLWNMVARSAFTQLRRSPWLLLGTLVGLAAIYWGPLVALTVGVALGDIGLAAAGALATLIMVTTYAPMVRYYHLGWLWALTLPAAAALYAAMTLDSARRHWQRRGVVWKGRAVGSAATRRRRR